MIVTGAKCALILFFSVASNTFFTSLFNFLHIREGTLAIAAPANQSQAHIRTLALVRIPAALYRWRRIWVRPQRRRVETRPPIFFLTVFHKFLPKRRKAGTSEKKSRLPANITLSVPLCGAAPVPPAAEAVRSAPARCTAAFPPHTKASRRPPAQTRRHF